jgi:hypothetical protein
MTTNSSKTKPKKATCGETLGNLATHSKDGRVVVGVRDGDEHERSRLPDRIAFVGLFTLVHNQHTQGGQLLLWSGPFDDGGLVSLGWGALRLAGESSEQK